MSYQAGNTNPNDQGFRPNTNQSGAAGNASNTTGNSTGSGQGRGKQLLQKLMPGKHGNNNNSNDGNYDNANTGDNLASREHTNDQYTDRSGNWDGQRDAPLPPVPQGAGTGVSGLEQDRMEHNLQGQDYQGTDAFDRNLGQGMGSNRVAGGNAPVDGMSANRTNGGNEARNWDNSNTATGTGTTTTSGAQHGHHTGRHVAEGAGAVGAAGLGEHEWKEHERRQQANQPTSGQNWDDTGRNYDQNTTGNTGTTGSGTGNHRGRHLAEAGGAAGAAGLGEHEWKEHERRQQGQQPGQTGNDQSWGKNNTGYTSHPDHRGRHVAEGAAGVGAAGLGEHEWREHERHQQAPGQTQQPGYAGATNQNTYATGATPGGMAGINQSAAGNTNTGYSVGTSAAPDGGVQDSGHGTILSGKLEQAAGVLLGNEGMKTRGRAKEEEGARIRDTRNATGY